MKNRAKCKLCGSIIESFHEHDYITCKCSEISIWGGLNAYYTSANDYSNFLRVDDEGNEIVVSVKEKETSNVKPLYIETKPTRADLIKMLEEMAKNIENLPPSSMSSPLTNYDLGSLISLLTMIFKSE